MLKRRFVTCAAASLLFASVAAVSAGGCADTEGTFYVLSANAGEPGDGTCTFGESDVALLDGFFEVLGGGEYVIGLTVRNELSSLKDANKPRVETNHVEIYAVDVDIDGVVGSGDCPASFTYPSKGFVEPQKDGSTAVLAIPACVGGLLAQQMSPGETRTVTASFVVHGHTTGGDEVETPAYDFPIRVGRGAFCADVEDADFSCGVGVNAPAPVSVCKANSGP